MDVIVAKLLAGCLFFWLAVIFGWTPYFCFRRYSKQLQSVRTSPGQRPIVIQYLHSLASGVLIGTCFLHLLPESLRAVSESLSASHSTDRCPLAETINITNVTGYKTPDKVGCQQSLRTDHFPVAECLVALGFLLVYTIDSSITSCMPSQHKQSYMDADTGSRDQSAGDQRPHPRGCRSAQEAGDNSCHQQLVSTDRRWQKHLAGQGKPFSYARWLRSKLLSPSDTPAKRNQADIAGEHRTFIAPDADSHDDFDDHHEQVEFSSGDCESTRSSSRSVEAHPLAAWSRAPRAGRSTQLRSVTLVSALCIHGFFDGVMLGLQTSLPVVMSLTLALSVHKSFVSVGLSTSLLTSQNAPGAGRVTLCYIVAFASTAPLGVVLAAAVLHNSFDAGDGGIVPGCLQAFAVGTFLYVSFTETADGHERRKLPTSLVNLVFLLTGFSLMTALRAALGSV